MRGEKIPTNQPKAKKTAKPWIWILVLVLIVLGCCVAVIGGGLVYLGNQDLGWGDVLPVIWKSPQSFQRFYQHGCRKKRCSLSAS